MHVVGSVRRWLGGQGNKHAGGSAVQVVKVLARSPGSSHLNAVTPSRNTRSLQQATPPGLATFLPSGSLAMDSLVAAGPTMRWLAAAPIRSAGVICGEECSGGGEQAHQGVCWQAIHSK